MSCRRGPWRSRRERSTAPAAVREAVGGAEGAASALLDGAGLDGDFVQAESMGVEAGTVISADPGEGEEVPVGSTVEVTVSTGPEAADVPDVTDMPREDA